MSKTRFIHFRNYRRDGTVDNFGGVTVAFREEGNGQVRLARQGCFYKDNFCRKQGRDAAEAKLNDPLQSHVVQGDIWDFHKRVKRIPNSSNIVVE